MTKSRTTTEEDSKPNRTWYQSFNNVQQGMSNFQQSYQGNQNPQQQMVQNFQQGNQQLPQANQQRKIPVTMFPCPLSCQHSVPWGSLSGCDNFKAMTPQMRKDSVDKLRTTKCCLKKGGKSHDPSDCRSPLCQCGRAPPHNELICPTGRVQMTNLQP